MKKKSSITEYFFYRKEILVLFLVFSGVVLGMTELYGVKTEAVRYSLILCALLLLLFGIGDFYLFVEKKKRRRKLAEKLGGLDSHFYTAKDPVEQDYLDMLRDLSERYCEQSRQQAKVVKERQEYDVTWVHQIKTPISAMNMILQSMDTPDSRRLQVQVFRIEEYVEMILHYARLEEDGSDFLFLEYDLDDIIRKCVRKYAPLFVEKRMTLHFEPTNQKVLTDEKWFSFIVEQILSNAIKYTKQGGVTIRMKETGVLEIADCGMGIAPEDVPRVFEKGYTGYNGREDHKSTGIGLYLCKKTADKLHHEITLSSVLNEGTTVAIDIRRKDYTLE